MVTHKIIWRVAGALLLLAIIVGGVRRMSGSVTGSSNARETPSPAYVDRTLDELLERLERDHRARIEETRVLVERVAGWVEAGLVDSAEAHYAQGVLRFYGEGDAPAAAGAFRKAAEQAPDWAWAHNGLGIALFNLNRREEALDSFHRAMELKPGWPRPDIDLTILYRKAGEFAKAEEHALRALEKNPESAAAHNNYGVLLDTRGLHDRARDYYLRALELNPTLPAALYNMGCHYARQGEVEPAVDYLAKAIARDDIFREGAMEDPDFDPIREAPAFKRLVGAEE